MAVENLKSTKVTNFEAGTSLADGSRYGVGGFYHDTITTVETTSSSTSTYKLMPLESNVIPKLISIRSDGTADSPDTDVGLYHVQTATTYDGVITTALDLDDTGDHIAYNIGQAGTYKSGAPKALWELAGLTQDPGGNFYIFLSLDAANVAAGTHEVYMEAIAAQ